MADVPGADSGSALDEGEVEALYQAAALERANGSAELAALMDRYAEHGLPSVEECTPWETVRDNHYRRLGVDMDAARVA